MTAQQKLDRIIALINEGATVYICTATKAFKITRQTVAKFEAAGRPLFTVSGDSLFMATGRRYDCIDHTAIKAFRANYPAKRTRQ